MIVAIQAGHDPPLTPRSAGEVVVIHSLRLYAQGTDAGLPRRAGSSTVVSMLSLLPVALREDADRQRGVITRTQAISAGLSRDAVAARLASGKWRRLHGGVYATFSGPPDRQAALWAAVLRAGPGAALSHWTAAELDGLADRPKVDDFGEASDSVIHVTVPACRRVEPVTGVVVHRRRDAARVVHPVRLPPRIRLEETVLDLVGVSGDVWEAVGWITRALGRRLTTADLLRQALANRSRLRWRADIVCVLSPGWAGIQSLLEFRYLRDVERPHGIPVGRRQVRARRGSAIEYRDVLYDEQKIAVELDGRSAHPNDTRWQDVRRDNAAAASGIVTLRYGYREITARPCAIAAEIGEVLRIRGWSGSLRPCSRDCPAGSG